MSLPRHSRKDSLRKSRRLWLELLEDRTTPSSYSVVAHVDGFATDNNQDGSFETLNTTGTSVQSASLPATSGIDQQNAAPPWTMYNISYSGHQPLGQEFVPTFSSMDYLDLYVEDAGSDIGPGANFVVTIHPSVITNSPVGTSVTTFVPDGTNTGGGSTWTRFNFSSPVSLTPGATYVFKILQTTTGSGVANFALAGDNSNADTYTPGRAIIGGAAQGNQLDFLFKQGSNTTQPATAQRALAEFDIANIPVSTVVTSARIVGYVNTTSIGPSGLDLGLYGYTGNGGLTLADATAGSALVGSIRNPATGEIAIDVDPAWLQSMLGQYFVGFNMRVTPTNAGKVYFNSKESTSTGSKLTLQINPTTNVAPTAVNDSYTVAEDTTLTVAAPGFRANDTDPDSPSPSAFLVAGPTHSASFTFNGNGSFTYRGALNYNGPDSFTYRLWDGIAYSNTATVALNVTPVNDPPTAVNNSYSVAEDATLTVSAPGVLGNDADMDGDTLSAVLVNNVTKGTLSLNSNGSFVYTPNANFNGIDSFTYRSFDGTVQSGGTATVTITINAMNDPPVANDDAYSTNRGVMLSVPAKGVLNNDTDIDTPAGAALLAILVTGPSNGNLTLNTSGAFTYTPQAGFTGQDTFTYKARDPSSADSNVATVTITVNDVNNVPVAVNDSYTTTLDTTLNINAPGVLSNDTDANGDPKTAVLVANPANGSLTLNADGSFTYIPNTGYAGNDSFTYRVNDGFADSNTATVSIRVNALPVAVDDAYTTNEDTGFNIASPGVRGNDSDPNGDPLTVIKVADPTKGFLSLNSNGSFNYTPFSNANGTDTFRYKLNDGYGDSNIATVTITINPVNDAPTANNNGYSMAEDGSLTITGPGVLANDTDPEGNPLTAQLASNPANGTVTFNSDGSFVYTPRANFHGTDIFTYRASDGSLTSAPANVQITIARNNDAPVAVDDAFTMNEDTTLTFTAGLPVTYLYLNSQPGDYVGGGQVQTFTPATGTFASSSAVDNVTGFSYFDTVNSSKWWFLNFASPWDTTLTAGTYLNATRYPFQAKSVPGLSVSGEGRGSNMLTGQFTVLQALYNQNGNVVRFAANFEQHSEGAPPALFGEIRYNYLPNVPGLLANDTDIESHALTAMLVSGPSNGNLTLNNDGTFSYTPNPNFIGTDTFTYRAHDGNLQSNVATVTITVANANDDPVIAQNDAYTLNEDSPLTVGAPGVLGNDVNVDNDPLTATVVNGPTNGTIIFNIDGSFTYTPNTNFHGTDSFTYKVNDSHSDSNTATVSLTIYPVNDAPVAAPDAYTVAEDGTLTVASPGVLGNDSDAEGSPLSAGLVYGPGNGTLTFNINGSFTYTPNANYHGTDSFTYKANDGSQDGNEATVTLTVTSVNDAPMAGEDSYSVNEDNQLVISAPGLLANDNDVDGDPLTALQTQANGMVSPLHGTVTLNPNGSFTYTPDANFHGSDEFYYKAHDGQAFSTATKVSITVNPVNDAPVAVDNAYNVFEDATLTVVAAGVLGNDSDVEGSVLSAVLVSGPASGALTLNSDGSFSYTPVANYSGAVSFTYKANDGLADSNVATVTINVTPVNDAPVASNQSVSVAEDGEVQFTISATDVESPSGILVFRVASVPSFGALYSGTTKLAVGATFTGPPALRYEPGLGYDSLTADAFTFTAGDGSLTSAAATVSVNVTKAALDNTATIDAAGVVRIGGTAANDTILVAKSGNSIRVTINGVTKGTFSSGAVKEIRAWGRAGADSIEIRSLAIASLLEGGAGNDTLTGGNGNDIMFGGTGDDRMYGNSGNDFLVGGAGRDRLEASSGTDVLVGGTFARPWTLKESRKFSQDWVAGLNPQNGPDLGVLDTEIDTLIGGNGRDLFFASLADSVDSKSSQGDVKKNV